MTEPPRPDSCSVHFTVYGKPVGARFRVVMVRAHGMLAQEPASKLYARTVSAAARDAVKQQGWVKPARDVPLILHLAMWCPMPTSWSKKAQTAHWGGLAVTAPDTDNYVKLFSDACLGVRLAPRTHEGIVFDDDRQVAGLAITRRWCMAGEARVEATVELAKE